LHHIGCEDLQEPLGRRSGRRIVSDIDDEAPIRQIPHKEDAASMKA
jgi:hypothetical protein